jgi:hypothetical protein
VGLFKRHVIAVSIVSVAVATVGAVFAFARPAYHPYVIPPPPDHGLTYTTVDYNAADARRAFKAEGIALVLRSRHPPITDLSNSNLIVVVDVFGERARVEASGFFNYTTDATGHFVHYARDCASGIPGVPGSYDAEVWRGNVRAIVNCDTAGKAGAAWLRRAKHALARL